MQDNNIAALRLTKEMIIAQMVERDVEKALSFFTDDISWFGTSEEDDIHGISEAANYLRSERDANPAPYTVSFKYESGRYLAEGSSLAEVKADISSGEITLNCRLTAVTKTENGQEKLCSVHMSIPDRMQDPGEYFPFSLAKKYENEVYQEFIDRSLNAGVIGSYLEKGYPVYTVNSQYLEMLGYSSEEEFLADCGNCATHNIHPDDFTAIEAETLQRIMETGRYMISYRLRKRDGSYIFVEDSGKLISTEDGRPAIISLCSDVTEKHDTFLRLKDQAEQLRLYHVTENAGAFRIIVDDRFTLLYGNDRFFQLVQYTEEEFHTRLCDSAMLCVHPDDRPMVKELIKKALKERPDKYAQWVMRAVTGDGKVRYLQVTVSFVLDGEGRNVMEGVNIDITDQKELELALRLEQEKTAAALSSSSILIWEYDVANHISIQQPKAIGAYGVPEILENMPESAVEMGLVPDESAQDYIDCYRRIESGAPEAEAIVQMKDTAGDLRWLHIHLKNIYDGAGRPVRAIGLSEDVTEQKLAQRQFDEELRYSEAVQDENLLVKARCNYSKNKIESYIAKGDAALASVGVSCDETVACMAKSAYTAEEGLAVTEACGRENVLRGYEQGKRHSSIDYRRRMNDGKVIWVNSTSKVYLDTESGDIKSFMYTRDINREKTYEDIIHTVATTVLDYILHINIDTDEFALFMDNRADDCLTQYPFGDGYVEKMKLVNMASVHPSDVERSISDMMPDRIRANLSSGKVFSAVYRSVDNAGAPNYKRIHYAWLNKELGQIIMTRTDVTDVVMEQQMHQQLLVDALAKAEQASNAKTDFLSKMSHEIRTPMNAIIGMNALAAQQVDPSSPAADYIAKVGISSRYLLSLINDILDMSRIESGKLDLKKEVIPFKDFLNGINTIIYEQATEHGISYDSIVTSFVSEAYVGDAMKLQQVLVNLLGNAVKFTPDGGRVQLIISQERVEKDVAHMKFIINDTGIGINEEFQKVMFEPFEQEHSGITSPYGGTGLGLAITKNLVSMMGGTISVNSIPGVGTEFIVGVPLGITAEHTRRQASSALHLEKLAALIVDDEILICQQTKLLLSDMGMKAEWVESGPKAVELVRAKWEAHKSYDIILIDWKMPEMDGIETARRIRSIVGPDVTIIIITAYEWAEIEQEAREAGVNMLITKPLFKSSLISTFEKIYAEKEEERRPSCVNREYDFTGKRVLIVEDHLLNVEVAKRLLQARGMETEVAENGLAAIEAYAASPLGHFDAILMDIRMPVMDGLTATRSIRMLKKETARTIPIIAMSANAFDEDVEKSRNAGMNAHLSKPIEPRVLYETLARFMTDPAKEKSKTK